MISKKDRFWISFILRGAFGFFFLIASINIFSAGGPHDFGPDWFAKNLSKPFQSGWMGDLLPMIDNPFQRIPDAEGEENVANAQEANDTSTPPPAEGEGAGSEASPPAAGEGGAGAGTGKSADDEKAAVSVERVHATYVFLFCLPFIFAGLSVPILTGIFLKPALRVAALLLVVLGLGKYIADGQDLATTANDFFFAFLICIALWFLGQPTREEVERSAAS